MEQLKLFGKRTNSEIRKDDSSQPSKGVQEQTFKKFRSKEEYYQSEEWDLKRLFALHRAQNSCDRCGSKGPLQIHHITYDRLYHERPEDLEVLCIKCHKKADREREYNSWHEGAFETYMMKKYGENWDYFEGCEEEFDDWLESKGNDY
jgi:hypothetical protein